MKTIGLLGGMSWESTVEYYKIINRTVAKRLGGLHSAEIVLHSVDFGPVEQLMQQGDWDAIANILIQGARNLERAGADFFLICTNTMHKLAPRIAENISIPLLHIADAAAGVLQERNITKAGLLGTAFTMEDDFYRSYLEQHYDLEVIIPDGEDCRIVNRIIFEELCRGVTVPQSRDEYIRIMTSLTEAGAEAIILGCTEIGLLVQQNDVAVQLIDTTPLHAAMAVDMALADVPNAEQE